MIMGQGQNAVYRLLVDTLAQAPRLQLDDLGMFPAVRALGNDTTSAPGAGTSRNGAGTG